MRALLNRLEHATALDAVGDRLKAAVQAALKPQVVRDALHGVWLGHPLHPAIILVPVGSWVSAAVLDLIPGERRAATTLVGVGVAGAIPAALSGANDWAELSREQRRVGLVHAMGNTVALGLYVASLAARLRGDHGRGRTLAFAGLSVAGGSAYLGGHLAYKQGAQMNAAVPDLYRIEDGWQPVADLTALPEGKPVGRSLGQVPVLVYRDGGSVSVLLDHCGHQTGPLSEGEVVQVGGRACIECPWHGSVFRLEDGLVMHGPAANDQPCLQTRVDDGVVYARVP
jgi:nitrite reductase/ring-hydroxylating ferredoxin subunit